MNKLWILKNFASVKGVNDTPIAQVVSGFLVLASFHGKNCEKTAMKWKRRFEKGLTPNNLPD